MSINESALKKFAETFGPAIEAIPAVIEAASKARDYERLVAESLDKLQLIEDACAKEREDKLKSIANADAKLAKILVKKAEASKELGSIEADFMSVNSSLQGLKDKLKAETEVAVSVKQAKIDALDDVFKAKTVALEKDLSKIKDSLESEIKQLETKRKSVETSLAKLKAKLG